MCRTNHIDTVRIRTEVLKTAANLTHHVKLVGYHGRDYRINQGVEFSGCKSGPRKEVSIQDERQHTGLTDRWFNEPLGNAVDDTRLPVDFRAEIVPA